MVESGTYWLGQEVRNQRQEMRDVQIIGQILVLGNEN